MNGAYREIIAASNEDRRGLFLTAAERLNTTLQNIEKDFWVCWTLDALFHRLKPGGPRLLFKGGTSLSKGYGLMSRFSEDIDITVFRDDIGARTTIEDLEQVSKKARGKRIDAIKEACQRFINGPLLAALSDLATETMAKAGQDPKQLSVIADPSDQENQSLLVRYPTVADGGGYIAPFVKIESGAKSALDPHEARSIAPYLAADVPNGSALTVAGVTTIDPRRTFLDKILILHGLPIYFARNGKLYGAGQVSRHYYDIHCLVVEPIGKEACTDTALVEDCVKHARMFFYRKHTGLEDVTRGSFRLKPSDGMIDLLRRDYDAMATMIFGQVPPFDAVLESIANAEEWLNGV